MSEFFNTYQVYMLFGCGITCIMLTIYVFLIRFNSIRKKTALAMLELSFSGHLFSDAIKSIYEGIPGKAERVVVECASFLGFTFMLAAMYFLTAYVTALFMGSGRFTKLPRRLLAGFIMPGIGLLLLIISQFTGMCYYIDENNCYVQGPLYIWCIIVPSVSLLIIFSFVIQYRKVISQRLLIAVMIFSVFPLIAAIIELFFEATIVDFVCWLGAVVLFGIALFDQNLQLLRAASYDMATGLPNAFGFIYEVDRIIHFQDITEYAGLYIDIVRMGSINNKYSKKTGDDVIIAYAEHFKKTIGKDEVFGRLGGNFFVALIKKNHLKEFIASLSDIPIEIKFDGKKEILHVSAVAGIYENNTKSISASQIVSNAATAVNYAKNVAKKPYVYLDDELNNELIRIRKLEENSRRALDRGEFLPFYQPKVDTTTNTICGAEALARWKSEERMVSPMEFVPVMEKNGSICSLDFYILECVCKDIKAWIDNGLNPVTVSVNFSRRNLGNPILAEAINKVVEKYDIPKNLIQIEITETLDEYPLSYLIGVVEALHKYGMTAAIDDFGTGSSSIRLLKEVNFDILKIDKSFVDYEDDKDKELLGDIIHMANKRQIHVIAEGVEKMHQVDELKKMSCFAIQGYAFDKPLEKTEFETRLKNKKY